MKILEGFRLRKLGNEHIIIGEGLQQVNFNKMVSLNETAAFLWYKLEGRDFTVEDMADLLCGEYEVSREVALKDAAFLAEKWLEAGLITK